MIQMSSPLVCLFSHYDLRNKDPRELIFALIGKRNDTYFVAICDMEGDLDIPRTVLDRESAQACFNYIDSYFPGIPVKVDINNRVANHSVALVKPFHNPLPPNSKSPNSKIRNLLGLWMQTVVEADPEDLKLADGLVKGKLTFDS